jgi:hypothetical protein
MRTHYELTEEAGAVLTGSAFALSLPVPFIKPVLPSAAFIAMELWIPKMKARALESVKPSTKRSSKY